MGSHQKRVGTTFHSNYLRVDPISIPPAPPFFLVLEWLVLTSGKGHQGPKKMHGPSMFLCPASTSIYQVLCSSSGPKVVFVWGTL
mmetsp:Transcript_121075/g.210592  ORF Transcript_121075/g.210592 Transcript_121075/m.210592 type:complete len:85 (+) Transcript_121075:1010-1264(+)